MDHNKLLKILNEMGIPDHLSHLLKNLYAGQEATVRTGHGTTYWFKIGKAICQGRMLSPCLFNLHAEYIMRNNKHNNESKRTDILKGDIVILITMCAILVMEV